MEGGEERGRRGLPLQTVFIRELVLISSAAFARSVDSHAYPGCQDEGGYELIVDRRCTQK